MCQHTRKDILLGVDRYTSGIFLRVDSRSPGSPNLAQPPTGSEVKPQPLTLGLPPPTSSFLPAPLPPPPHRWEFQAAPPIHNEAVAWLGSSRELRGLVRSKSFVLLFVSFYLGASYLK